MQVVMRIIDPKTAVQLLHGESGAAPPIPTKQEPNTNGWCLYLLAAHSLPLFIMS